MRLSCYVPSQIIPKSRVGHLADKQILKRLIQSYPKIIVSKNPGGLGGGVIPGPWTIDTLQTSSSSLLFRGCLLSCWVASAMHPNGKGALVLQSDLEEGAGKRCSQFDYFPSHAVHYFCHSSSCLRGDTDKWPKSLKHLLFTSANLAGPIKTYISKKKKKKILFMYEIKNPFHV